MRTHAQIKTDLDALMTQGDTDACLSHAATTVPTMLATAYDTMIQTHAVRCHNRYC